MSNRGYGTTGNSYWIRVRNREHHEIEIAGGVKRAGGRRRVARWGKWKTHRSADNAAMALLQYDAVKKLNPLSDIAVFRAGKRVTIEQLNHRATEDAAARNTEEET